MEEPSISERHDQLAIIMIFWGIFHLVLANEYIEHWIFAREYLLSQNQMENPSEDHGDNRAKIVWDFLIQTRIILTNQPNLVVI